MTDASKTLDPPKSSLKRRTLTPIPPFLRGVRGDLDTSIDFSNTLLNNCYSWKQNENQSNC
jgi:hypothetical protein